MLNFSKKHSKHTQWHQLDLIIDKLESTGFDDIKCLLQNITQYGIHNIFVVNCASHKKTYRNIAAKELK